MLWVGGDLALCVWSVVHKVYTPGGGPDPPVESPGTRVELRSALDQARPCTYFKFCRDGPRAIEQ